MVNIKNKLPEIYLAGGILGAVVFVVMHFSIVNRMLPFLKNDTVYSGGKYIPTEDMVDVLTPMFLYMAPVCVLVSVINYIIQKKQQP